MAGDRTVQRTSGGAATPAQAEALRQTPIGKRHADDPDTTLLVDDRWAQKYPSYKDRGFKTSTETFRLRLPETDEITGPAPASMKPKPKPKPEKE